MARDHLPPKTVYDNGTRSRIQPDSIFRLIKDWERVLVRDGLERFFKPKMGPPAGGSKPKTTEEKWLEFWFGAKNIYLLWLNLCYYLGYIGFPLKEIQIIGPFEQFLRPYQEGRDDSKLISLSEEDIEDGKWN